MTLGTMATDCEIRIDYDKLRRDRLSKMNEQLKTDRLGALLSSIRHKSIHHHTILNDWTTKNWRGAVYSWRITNRSCMRSGVQSKRRNVQPLDQDRIYPPSRQCAVRFQSRPSTRMRQNSPA